MIKVVIDTNAFISSLSIKSKLHRIIDMIIDEEIELLVTTEIFFEYEEKLKEKYDFEIADNFISSLKEIPTVKSINIFYQWFLLSDLDDNKFVDCYVSANADYLITNDSDFNKLKAINFPKINIITLQEFLNLN